MKKKTIGGFAEWLYRSRLRAAELRIDEKLAIRHKWLKRQKSESEK